MNVDLQNLLQWTAPKRVRTSQGERDLLIAQANQEFSQLWKSNKEGLKALGIGWGKDASGNWQVMWWRPIAAEEAAAKAASMEASKATNAEIEIPRPEGREYLGYQKAGIAYAAAREATLLADEMGLGKTIQAIGLINLDPAIKKVLIVCTATIKLNWKRELKRWLTRELSVHVVDSASGWGKADIRIINYDLLAKFETDVISESYDLAVIDESHRIKNPKAQRTKVFSQIQARRRVCMTGTPILNRPVELWTSLIWLDPARWNKKKSFFERRYCGAYQGQWGWVNDGATHLDELQEVLRTSVMVRRLKRDVLTELPAKQRQVVELEGDANAKRVARVEMAKFEEFKALLAEAEANKKQAEATGDKDGYAEAVAQLAQAKSIAFEEMSQVRHATAVAKVPMVVDFVKELLEGSDEKLVIFAHHRDVIEALEEELAEFNPVKLIGGMGEKAKQAAMDRFQTEAGVRVFLGNIQAAGEGITLTASSHVVFAELDWNEARIKQAEDRCHRIGQFDSVLVQHLVLEGSVDAYMADMIVDKQRVADAALDKPAKPIEVKEVATEIEVKEVAELNLGAMSQAQVAAAHQAMKILAGMCDGARSWDNVGFSKVDTDFGKKLASLSYLSAKQAEWAAKLANKYRRQLPAELLEVILKG